MSAFRMSVACAALLVLSACSGTVNVANDGKNIKRIELTDPPFIAFPRRAAFTHPESQMAMKTSALKECPNGYTLLKEQYVEDNGQGKDMLVWHIKCQ